MTNLKAFRGNGKTLSSDGKAIFMVFFGAVIAVVLIGTFGDSIYPQTTIYSWENNSITRPAVNTTTDLTGRELVGTAVVNNGTNVISEAVVSTGTSATTGLRTVQIYLNDTAFADASLSTINITYDFKPDGYLNVGGARGMASLILIMSCLAVLVFVVVVFIKHGTLGRLIGRQ